MTQPPPPNAPRTPPNAPRVRPNGPRSRRREPSFAKASPVLAWMAIWVLGGMLTAQLGSVWGWAQTVDRPLRAGTIQVRECHRDLGKLFVAYRCSGSATFAPESEWRVDARDDLRKRPNIALYSRSNVARQSVDFTCYDVADHSPNTSSYHVQESCHPDGQITGPLRGPKLWVPLGAAAATVVLGLAALIVLGWLFFGASSPVVRRELAAQKAGG